MATGFSPSYEKVSSLSDLYEKTNTTVKVGIKLVTEEASWLRDFPREKIVYSPNESRIPLILQYPLPPAMIPDFGYEAQLTTPSPTSGTFSMTQMNYRFSYSGLAEALDSRARAAMIVRQTEQQAMLAASGMGAAIGKQLYGSSVGTIAVVAATGSAGTTQNGIQLKNAYGSTLVPNTTTNQQTYLSNLFPVNSQIALVRSGTLVEFGTVNAAPSAGSGVGYIDATFNSSITPTANDVIVFASAVTDATITGTDYNNAPIGFADILGTGTLHGVNPSTYPNWAVGYSSTSSARFGYAMKEAMINGVWNAAGVQMNRLILGQGVKRDVVAGERGALRYDNAEDLNLEGDLKGFEYLTSKLALPGCAIGWYDQAFAKVEISNQPDDKMQPSIFKLDKVQDRSGVAAAYDYFRANLCVSRGAFAYASNLNEQ